MHYRGFRVMFISEESDKWHDNKSRYREVFVVA